MSDQSDNPIEEVPPETEGLFEEMLQNAKSERVENVQKFLQSMLEEGQHTLSLDRVSKVVADLQQQAKSPANEEFSELLDKVDEQSDAHAIISGLQLVAAEIARLREDLTDRIDSQASEN